MSRRTETAPPWSLVSVLLLVAILGIVVLIMACWTWWADDLAQAQQRLGADSVAGQALAGFLPTGLFCWLVATNLAFASRWGRVRWLSVGATVAVGIVSFLTVPIVVGGRGSGADNLTSYWGDALAAGPEPFRAGRIAAFVLVNGTIASMVLLALGVLVLAVVLRGRLPVLDHALHLGSTAVRDWSLRWVAVTYLLVAPVVVFLVTMEVMLSW